MKNEFIVKDYKIIFNQLNFILNKEKIMDTTNPIYLLNFEIKNLIKNVYNFFYYNNNNKKNINLEVNNLLINSYKIINLRINFLLKEFKNRYENFYKKEIDINEFKNKFEEKVKLHIRNFYQNNIIKDVIFIYECYYLCFIIKKETENILRKKIKFITRR